MGTVYPKSLDVFMPTQDGFTPIVADDLNDIADAITAIQTALGWGPSLVYRNLSSPFEYIGNGARGTNQSVKERLDNYLERDGGLKDIAMVTGESRLMEFDENGAGVLVDFKKDITGSSVSDPNPYSLWFQGYAPEGGTGVSTTDFDTNLAAHFWCSLRGKSTCVIKARGLNGLPLTPDRVKDTIIKWACLVVGGTIPGVEVS